MAGRRKLINDRYLYRHDHFESSIPSSEERTSRPIDDLPHIVDLAEAKCRHTGVIRIVHVIHKHITRIVTARAGMYGAAEVAGILAWRIRNAVIATAAITIPYVPETQIVAYLMSKRSS
jgi:hypothetical protein